MAGQAVIRDVCVEVNVRAEHVPWSGLTERAGVRACGRAGDASRLRTFEALEEDRARTEIHDSVPKWEEAFNAAQNSPVDGCARREQLTSPQAQGPWRPSDMSKGVITSLGVGRRSALARRSLGVVERRATDLIWRL